jgi:hypothetical protein
VQHVLNPLFITVLIGVPVFMWAHHKRKQHLKKRKEERRCRCKVKVEGGIKVMCMMPTQRVYQMFEDETVMPPYPGARGKGFHPHLFDLCGGGHARIAHHERKWFTPRQLERRRRRDPGQFSQDRTLYDKAIALEEEGAKPLLAQMTAEQERTRKRLEQFVHSQATSVTVTAPMPKSDADKAFEGKHRPVPRLRPDMSIGLDFRPNKKVKG